MTAHDDDQDLVSVRIPRRAAAMYAAEMDVLASPVATRLHVYAPFGAGSAAVAAGLILVALGVMYFREADLTTAAMFVGMGVFLAAIGALFSWLGLQLLASTRKRGLL